jgi:hypothetical protein
MEKELISARVENYVILVMILRVILDGFMENCCTILLITFNCFIAFIVALGYASMSKFSSFNAMVYTYSGSVEAKRRLSISLTKFFIKNSWILYVRFE